MMAANEIKLGQRHCMVAGGMESMSNVPYYVPALRWGNKLNDTALKDGVVKDGLWDPYGDCHMGSCAEVCATTYDISRQDQDAYAIESYARANKAHAAGKFTAEITPMTVGSGRRQATITADEQITKLAPEKMAKLGPVFQSVRQGGSVTACNASPLSDGAAALVMVSGSMMQKHGLTPIAKVLGYADAEKAPVEFTTAPSDAIPKALAAAGKTLDQVDYFEINEAFSVVSLANNQILKLDPKKVNVYGGAVAMGHPLGCSGARILVTLCSVLAQEKGSVGVAGICNGGGGASALVIERC